MGEIKPTIVTGGDGYGEGFGFGSGYGSGYGDS